VKLPRELSHRRSASVAWTVHLYTASGVVFALLATLELFAPRPDPRWVFLWLAIAVLIDATDGPLARRYEVKRHLPQISGRTIDDLVDYLTFTFIPLLLVYRMEWVPEPRLLFIVPALITSLLGFANSGAKDEQRGFFLGFPSYWNIVAFYAGINAAFELELLNGVMLLALAVLTLMPVGFIYPNLAPLRWRGWILAGAVVWFGILLMMLASYPRPPFLLIALSLVYPIFYGAVSITEYRKLR
jgi:phosphatidylcholine synthase